MGGPRLEARAVLAAAYKAGTRARMLTHGVIVDAQGLDVSVLCRRVAFDSLADALSLTPDDRTHVPTCRDCARQWRKLKEGFCDG
jgi:hypothetical protein